MVDVQTRSETNGLKNFPSLKEAMKYADSDDPTVWKISFFLPNGEIVRLVMSDNLWVYDSIYDSIYKGFKRD